MRRRLLGVVIAAAIAVTGAGSLAGCGPSSAQVRAAREARYYGDRDEVFRLAAAAVVAEDHEIEAADVAAGQLITKGRWYEAKGNLEDIETQPDGSEAVVMHHGSLLLAFKVAVIGDRPSVQVVVEPVAAQWLVGATSLKPMAIDDPDAPSWVERRADELQIAIHNRLRAKLTASPGTAPSSPDD